MQCGQFASWSNNLCPVYSQIACAAAYTYIGNRFMLRDDVLYTVTTAFSLV